MREPRHRASVERYEITADGETFTAVRASEYDATEDLVELLQVELAGARKLLARAAGEMEESCEREGRLTSMLVCAKTIRAFLAAQERKPQEET